MNTSAPSITNVRFDSDIRSPSGFRVYTSHDAPCDASEPWFDKHNIHSLTFKCKAWNAVARAATKISAEEMVPVIAARFNLKPEDFSLKFSRTAGCSCGCSPGYVGKVFVPHGELSRVAIRLENIPLSDANRARLDKVMVAQTKKLVEEIAAQPVAPTVAA